MIPTQDELDCAADALRRFEQGGKNLNLWGQLPNSTRKKWLEKVAVVLGAMARERNRVRGDAEVLSGSLMK